MAAVVRHAGRQGYSRRQIRKTAPCYGSVAEKLSGHVTDIVRTTRMTDADVDDFAVPPLWHKMIDPLLADWDERLADDVERSLVASSDFLA